MTDETLRGQMVARHEATEALIRAEVETLRAKVAAAEKMASDLRWIIQNHAATPAANIITVVNTALKRWDAAND